MFKNVVKVVLAVGTVIGGAILGKEGICGILKEDTVAEPIVDTIEEAAEAVADAVEEIGEDDIQ